MKLDFNEVDGERWCIAGREKYTINAEGKLFDFNRGELIGVSGFRGLVDEFKEDAGEGLKEAIEDGIGFHEA